MSLPRALYIWSRRPLCGNGEKAVMKVVHKRGWDIMMRTRSKVTKR